jgi:hypothetical protein
VLVRRRYIDRRRVFAAGGSYGGYMVAWMNGRVPHGKYRAYICHAGCFDWVSMFADDTYPYHAKEFGAWYWKDMKKVEAQNPRALARNMTTPTLVIHGALDFRVPETQGIPVLQHAQGERRADTAGAFPGREPLDPEAAELAPLVPRVLRLAEALRRPAAPPRGAVTQPQRSRLDAWFDGLWSNYDFRRLWISLTITHFGGQITFLALPLTAALLLSATPFQMGVLTALESLPFALFGLFAGVLVDRSRKLPLIIWADVGARWCCSPCRRGVDRNARNAGALCGRVPRRQRQRRRVGGVPGVHDRARRARRTWLRRTRRSRSRTRARSSSGRASRGSRSSG